MGDRCYSRHRIQRSRLAEHVAVFCESDTDDSDDSRPYELCGSFEELNYGGFEGYQKLAAKGVAFIVSNDQGGEYGPHELVSDGARFSECETLDDGLLAVPIDSETGKPYAHKLRHARRHLEIRRGAERILSDPFPAGAFQPTPEYYGEHQEPAVETVADTLVLLGQYAPEHFPNERSQASDLIETYQVNAGERTDEPISDSLLAELLSDLRIEADAREQGGSQ